MAIKHIAGKVAPAVAIVLTIAGWTCPASPASSGTSDTVFYVFESHHTSLELAKKPAETLAELKARISREAAQYWGWIERTGQKRSRPPQPRPRTRNRCCSGSSKHMVRT